MTIRELVLPLIIVCTWMPAAPIGLTAAGTSVPLAGPNLNRDISGTSRGPGNELSSQTLVNSALPARALC